MFYALWEDKKGQPSSLLSSVPKKRKVPPKQPQKEVRKDGDGHSPLITKKRLLFKNCSPSENTFSSVICSKCEVTLCLNKDRNCFYDFHKH